VGRYFQKLDERQGLDRVSNDNAVPLQAISIFATARHHQAKLPQNFRILPIKVRHDRT